jgi:hypothetical protein
MVEHPAEATVAARGVGFYARAARLAHSTISDSAAMRPTDP